MTSSRFFSSIALAALAFLAACGGGETSDDSSGGATQASSSGGTAGPGSNVLNGGISGTGLTLRVVGGRGIQDVSSQQGCGLASVFVTVVGVRANADAAADATSGGWIDVALPAPVRVDLQALAAGGALPVDLTSLPDGGYRQLRLLLAPDDANAPLADAVVTADGTAAALAVPDAAQGGLPLAVAITVAGGQVSASYRDLDVCQAVTNTAGAYALGALNAGATQVAASSY